MLELVLGEAASGKWVGSQAPDEQGKPRLFRGLLPCNQRRDGLVQVDEHRAGAAGFLVGRRVESKLVLSGPT